MRLEGILIIMALFWQVVPSVKEVRHAYFSSADNKRKAINFEQLLNSIKVDAMPVLVCYKGAAEMLKAKNTVNPFVKFSCFKRGRNLVEQALARDPSNIESHFIRYTLQQNLPWFLGYHTDMHQDSLLVAKGLAQMDDQDLKNKITNYFKHKQ